MMFHNKTILFTGNIVPLAGQFLQLHESIPRNPLIAEVCYRAGYIDSWGRGIEKISDACRHAGLPEPVIEENSGGVTVELLKAPAYAKAAPESRGNDFGSISDEASGWWQERRPLGNCRK